MQSHKNCLSYKVRSKDVRNNEKLDLAEMKINSKLLTNSLGKNLSHRPSAELQDLQYGKLCEFPTLIKLDIDSVVEEPCAENLSSFFNLRHLKNKLWLATHMLSEVYKLLENLLLAEPY